MVPVVDFWEDDLDQLGEALGMDARVSDAGCGSAVLLWQLLGSGVWRPRALRSVFPLIPAKQTCPSLCPFLQELVLGSLCHPCASLPWHPSPRAL